MSITDTKAMLEWLRIKEPTTAFDILNRVVQLTQEQPARMNITVWRHEPQSGTSPAELVSEHRHAEVPRCGVVGCIAGWCSIMLGLPEDYAMTWNEDYPVARLLKLNTQQARALFVPFDGDFDTFGTPGTLAHATAVVEHIREFQEENEVQLKGTIITPADVQRELDCHGRC